MERGVVAALAAATMLATFANPHFLFGGEYDVSTFAPGWQWSGALVCLSALAAAARMDWRRAPGRVFRLLPCELILFLSVTAGAVASVGRALARPSGRTRFLRRTARARRIPV